MNHPKYLLEVARSSNGVAVCQRKYKLELLADSSYFGCKTVNSPMKAHLKLSSHEGDELSDPSQHRRLIENFYI